MTKLTNWPEYACYDVARDGDAYPSVNTGMLHIFHFCSSVVARAWLDNRIKKSTHFFTT